MFVCTVIFLAVAAPLLLLLFYSTIFLKFKKKYGPIFMMRMSGLNTLVIASTDDAMQLLKTHHQSFINRHPLQTLQPPADDDYQATPYATYGPIWRINRRLFAKKFSRTTMNNTLGKRRQFVDQIIQWIMVEAKEGRSVEIKHLTSVAFANLLGNLFFSKDVMDLKSATGSELYQLLVEIVVVSSKLNLADLFPGLRKEKHNLANRMKKAVYAFVNIIEGLAKERRSTHVYFVGHEPTKLSDRYIIFFIMVSKFILEQFNDIFNPIRECTKR
ncbi:hypothetical protein MKW98_021296 [Papaver atlanticum]|uniref:Cytochrome P450 n=1 Tax=Papaver atlanticum TaxID=357466 RepID=A0AAD4SPR0_9MAGN|nr:hypothetical protein MKW98_021296 [Papaver atlanticum]